MCNKGRHIRMKQTSTYMHIAEERRGENKRQTRVILNFNKKASKRSKGNRIRGKQKWTTKVITHFYC